MYNDNFSMNNQHNLADIESGDTLFNGSLVSDYCMLLQLGYCTSLLSINILVVPHSQLNDKALQCTPSVFQI